MLENIHGIIFDLDGTLIDSMGVWTQIDKEYLAAKGFQVPDNLVDEISHLGFDAVALYFKNTFGLSDSTDLIKATWHQMAIYHYSNDIPMKSGASEFLRYLKRLGLKIGLATSNSRELLEAALRKHDIYDYFDTISITSEVARGKNFPDVYLLSAERLGVAPEQCLVFEDLYAAVMGAKAAGMKVAGVYDIHSEHQWKDIKRVADYYVTNYVDLLEDLTYGAEEDI